LRIEQEFAGKLERAVILIELRLALKELVRQVEPLWPNLSALQQWHTRRRPERVVSEVTDSAAGTHWREVYLDLIAIAAG
jgi:hypothetical protein